VEIESHINENGLVSAAVVLKGKSTTTKIDTR